MKQLRPYIVEFLVFLFCIVVIVGCLLIQGFITIKLYVFPIMVCVVLSSVLLWVFYGVFRRGVSALIDAIFQTHIDVCGKVVKIIPMRGGIFTDKAIEPYVFSVSTRYLYVFKMPNAKMVSIVSDDYFDF